VLGFTPTLGQVRVATEAIGVVLPDIRAVVDAYAKKDVFDMDETSLCWRLQADNSLATHQLEGRKINKERITLVICANSDSSEKISLTIIGKHLNPRCFKGINRDTLGARYHANAKAWMTQDIFRLWLLDFDRRMQGCQVLLLLDNCRGHPLGEVCGDERGFSQHPRFLPVTKHDLGSPTLRCWDHTHIQSILQKAIQQPTSGWLREQHRQSRKDQHSGCIPPMFLDVSPATIANYFRHYKIRTNDIIHTQQGEVGPPTALIQELQHQMAQLPYRNPMDICNLLNYPEENNYMVVSNDEDITNCIIEELRPQQDEDATSDNDDSVEAPKISTHQAQEYLEGLTLFWMQQKESYHEFSESLKEQKEDVKKINMTGLK